MTWRLILSLLAAGLAGGRAFAQPSVLMPLSEPTGVATDAGGDLYAFSQVSISVLAQRLTPAAQPVWQKEMVDFSLFFADVRASVDPGSGILLVLYQQGPLVQFDPETGEYHAFTDLINLPEGASWDATRVFDMSIPEVRDLTSKITITSARMGDLAARRDGDTLELWVTLRSGKTPYLARLRAAVTLEGGLLALHPPVDARILVTSTRAVSSNTTIPRGVAVSTAGTVVTSLPIAKVDGGHPDPALSRDALVCLRSDFEPRDFPSRTSIEFESANRCLELPCKIPVAMFNNAEFAAEGADVDADGNFFLSSGFLSTAIHPGSSGGGGVVLLSLGLTQREGVAVGDATFDARDLAVTRDGATAYLTGVGGLFDTGSVVALPIASIPVDPPETDPGSGDGSSDSGGDSGNDGTSDSDGSDIENPPDDGDSDPDGSDSGDTSGDATSDDAGDGSEAGGDGGDGDAGDGDVETGDNSDANVNENASSDAVGPPRSAAGSSGAAANAAPGSACPTAAVVLVAGLSALTFATRRSGRAGHAAPFVTRIGRGRAALRRSERAVSGSSRCSPSSGRTPSSRRRS